jgi:histidinol-phosphatase (PHP family)
MYSNDDQSGFDYLIGAVHYLNMDGEYVAFDRPAQTVKDVVYTRFGGDGLAFAKRYYQELARLPQYGSFDILGHFDLVTKNIEHMPALLDTQSKAYLDAAKETIHALKGHIPLFEVNTGAIARGHRTTPYPALELVREFREAGFGAVITSDCHDAAKLDCAFEDARALLEAAGFRERYILTGDGFRAVEL